MRQSWTQGVFHTASGESKTVVISVNPNSSPSEPIESSEDDSPVLSFEEKLQVNLVNWGQTNLCVTSNIDKQRFYKNIYGLLGNIVLKPEVVQSTIQRFINSEKAKPAIIFKKLEDFYSRWCDAEFIDAAPDNNLPQQQMLHLQSQNIAIGLR